MNLIDITQPVNPSLPTWPGDEPLRITGKRDDRGILLSSISTTLHLGTHVDAPLHGLESGAAVSDIPLDRFIGPAWVAELTDVPAITSAHLEALSIKEGTTRLLLKTDNSRHHGAEEVFDESFVALTRDAAEWIVKSGIELVGIDAPSVQPFNDSEFDTHRVLMSAGVLILEGLLLRDVTEGDYELICLPLKIIGVEGVPVRAILRS